jgi:hypothetical protein
MSEFMYEGEMSLDVLGARYYLAGVAFNEGLVKSVTYDGTDRYHDTTLEGKTQLGLYERVYEDHRVEKWVRSVGGTFAEAVIGVLLSSAKGGDLSSVDALRGMASKGVFTLAELEEYGQIPLPKVP